MMSINRRLVELALVHLFNRVFIVQQQKGIYPTMQQTSGDYYCYMEKSGAEKYLKCQAGRRCMNIYIVHICLYFQKEMGK